MKNPPKEIVILGDWDGEPIWREVTAEEKLLRALNKKENGEN